MTQTKIPLTQLDATIAAHVASTANPHSVTAAQVGVAAETNANELFRNDAHGASAFTALISSVGATTVVYKAPITGAENFLVVPTTNLAKIILYNTTRGTSALVSTSVVATKTITLTAAVPAGWAANDAITIASQTVSGGGTSWVDLNIVSGPTGKTALFICPQAFESTTAGRGIRLHPFETYADSKVKAFRVPVISLIAEGWMTLLPIISDKFAFSNNTSTAAGALSILREAGYIT